MSDESTPETPQPSEMELLRVEMRTGFQSVASEMELLRVGMRTGFQSVAQRLDQVDERFDQVDKRFAQVDKRFAQVDKRFAQVDERGNSFDKRFDQVDKRFEVLEARISEESAAIRRHFDVIAEGLRAEMKVVIDKTIFTGEKLDRHIAANAIEHAAFVHGFTDHEVRITRLEAATDKSKPPTT